MPATKLRPAELSDWLVAHGKHFVTNDDIAELVDVAPSDVRHSLRRQREANTMVPVTKGAWVPVPPQYRRNGAPPVDHFIVIVTTSASCRPLPCTAPHIRHQ